ncbi:MAG: zonular occludens toxin domain-containing protein [Polynucleobacter sp.]|uniref:zonular occludens toxin domain-containing protein n=1 Tax=Polynucleobacter sp. TaxID=2029855 RepID=UPI002719592B|nr:zonular occludens toxin domain-containing protein [Polynucleobacter sp.]MDO8713133.1 zonular occludens toxin domain-containing protein [Polynucleobacter sp.]
MITLITGQPGAGKTLYVVAELLFKMVNDTFEIEGETIKRTIYSNIKGLVIDHVHMDAKDLASWPEWCKPGDIICFDEVQEVWRPRGMSTNPPAAIQALEIHRSKYSIDCIFMTQHPMLLDQNIRRLVNRHLHIRRIAKLPLAWVYEWDHASNPSMVRSAVSSGKWLYPRWAYKLYVSAKVHTSQPRALPKALLYLGSFIVGGFFVFFPQFFPDALTPAFLAKKPAATVSVVVTKGNTINIAPVKAPDQAMLELKPSVAPVGAISDLKAVEAPFKPLGCAAMEKTCQCYGDAGQVIEVVETECRKALTDIAYVMSGQPQNHSTQRVVFPVAAVESSGKAQPVKEEKRHVDSGFNLPIRPVAGQYDQRYSMGPSGTLYAQ